MLHHARLHPGSGVRVEDFLLHRFVYLLSNLADEHPRVLGLLRGERLADFDAQGFDFRANDFVSGRALFALAQGLFGVF